MLIIKILGAIAAAVIVGVIAVGLGMYFQVIPIPGPILSLLTGSNPPEYSARYYPPSAVAYGWVTLAPGQGQLGDMREIWRQFNEFPAFRDLVDEVQDDFRDDTRIDFEEDVMPWVGPEFSAGLLDVNLDSGDFVGAAMIGVRNRKAAAEFLEKWLEHLEASEGARFDSGAYRNFDVWENEHGDEVYALTDDWIVVATSAGVVELLLDRIAGESDDSLATDANFRAARAALPERRFASSYLNYREATHLWGQLAGEDFDLASLSPWLDQAPSWLAMSAAWVERGVVTEVVSPTAPILGLQAGDLGNPAQLLPQDTLAFIAATFDPDLDNWRAALGELKVATWLPDPQAIDELNSGLELITPVNPPQLNSQSTLADALDLGLGLVESLTGIELESDLFDYLGGELILALGNVNFVAVESDPASNPVEAALMLSYREDGATGLARTLRDVQGLLEGFVGLTATPTDVGAADVAYWFPLEPLVGETGYTPGYVLHDGYLTLASTRETLSKIVKRQNGSGMPLSKDPEYRRAAAHLPVPQQLLAYVDVNGLIQQIGPEDADLDVDEYRILVDGIGVATFGSSSGEAHSRSVAVLTLFPE